MSGFFPVVSHTEKNTPGYEAIQPVYVRTCMRDGDNYVVPNLLYLEDVFVEVLLELLIGIVDAKLLKRVLLKHFKAKDVQHAN